jgi:hypothetical protein
MSIACRNCGFARLVERFHAVGVVRKGQRMDQPVKRDAQRRQVVAQPADLIFELDVADINGCIAQQLGRLLPAGFVLDDVEHPGTDLVQHGRDVVRDALAVRHAEHDDILAGKLQKIHRQHSSMQQTAHFVQPAQTLLDPILRTADGGQVR